MPREARVVVVHPNANSVESLALLTMHHVKVIRQALQLQVLIIMKLMYSFHLHYPESFPLWINLHHFHASMDARYTNGITNINILQRSLFQPTDGTVISRELIKLSYLGSATINQSLIVPSTNEESISNPNPTDNKVRLNTSQIATLTRWSGTRGSNPHPHIGSV